MSARMLAVGLALQVALGLTAPEAMQQAPAPPPAVAKAAALGEDAVAARLAMLVLQSEDRRVALRTLDYEEVERWLDTSMALDPRSSYPMQLATLVYATVPDAARSRRMLAFVERHFDADPARHRGWMEYAAVIARHQLDDPAYAAALEQKLNREQLGAAKPAVPLDWQRKE